MQLIFLVVLTMCCSWIWLYNFLDFASEVKAAPLSTVESASEELTEGSNDEDKQETITEKKKRTGFRDRKVV